LICVFVPILAIPVLAQDLEPRAYSASPVGLNFLVLGFGYSTGSVLFDPTRPISNVKANLNIPTAGYGRTFGLFGRQGLLTARLPYVWGNIDGAVLQQSRSVRRSGLADTRVNFSINLRGSPARSPTEFAQLRKRSFIVGAGLTASSSTGQYDPTKLINIGTNRWAFKPELGISYPLKRCSTLICISALGYSPITRIISLGAKFAGRPRSQRLKGTSATRSAPGFG